MSILPFARGSFENMKCKHPKIGFVTIMLTKRVFGVKNLLLNFFEGVGGRAQFGRLKSDIFV
jgi:hypothetical protein